MKTALVAALFCLFATREASAQRRAARDSSGFAVFNAVPFVAADVVYSLRPGWAAPGWSIPEILHGTIYVSVMMANATDDLVALHRAAWIWGIFGFGMLVHGCLSLALWELPSTRPAAVSMRIGPGALFLDGRF